MILLADFMNDCSTGLSHVLKSVTSNSTATDYIYVDNIKSNIHKMTCDEMKYKKSFWNSALALALTVDLSSIAYSIIRDFS